VTNSHERVKGVVVPLLAPVNKNTSVDEVALRALIQHCVDGGADALFAGGTSGMGPLWPMAEWVRMMEVAHDAVGGAVPLLGGVIETSTKRAVERIRVLEQIGYQHMVVTPTFYVTLERNEEFLAHYAACREATDLNMIAYNIPSCTQASIPIAVLEIMAARGWIQCLKESSGDQTYFSRAVEALAGTDIAVLQGFEPDMAWGFRHGAVGVVPVCANYAPEVFTKLVQAASAQNNTQMDALQDEIMAVRKTLLLGDKNWLAGAVYGLHTLGIGSGSVLDPLQMPGQAERAKIESMTAIRMHNRKGTP